MLSGINRGSNMGEDVTYSGTVAAAMEATLLGIPAIAMSQLRDGQQITWRLGLKHGADVVRRLVSVPWAEGVLMNVNFPYIAKGDITGMQVVRQGRRAANIEVAHADAARPAANSCGSAISPATIPWAAAPISGRCGQGPSPSRRCISI